MYHKVINLANKCTRAQVPWYIEQPLPWGPEDDNATIFDFPVDLCDSDKCELGAKIAKPFRLVHYGIQ